MTATTKHTFRNNQGAELASVLHHPLRAEPRAFVLFAHCFTCGKDALAAVRISRSLANQGFAVLRFDFAGLGESEGEFSKTSFSSNVEDLLAAARYLRETFSAPGLLVGHSLGGTAALAAAGEIPECKAIATIAAPMRPAHILSKFSQQLQEIRDHGSAEVNLAGRPFEITRQFVDDAESYDLSERIGDMRRALLVIHAPLDEVVEVDEAGKIFKAAKHPRSFISLDGADHLLSDEQDAQYVARTIAAWAMRYLPIEETKTRAKGGEVMVGEANQKFLREVSSDDHAWLADEPKSLGGENLGPDPYEHLLAALGTCTSMTLRMYANHKQWDVTDIDVRLTHSREHAEDCEHCDKDSSKIDVIKRFLTIDGDLTDEQRARLMEIADRCPVHRTLTGELEIRSAWEADSE